MMREAGITVVRLGHLASDTFEPADGEFTFVGLPSPGYQGGAPERGSTSAGSSPTRWAPT
jgi:hypothetical protein